MSARQETTLIYSSGGNKQYAEIASSCGFELGSQLPSTLYAPIYFADQDDKKPNRKAYMNALALHKPHMATVLDWKLLEQFSTIMDWAEEASQWAEVIIVIPKVHNQMHRIPKRINGKEVRIGYSVPTSHGGTEVMLWEFSGREVHLLGGSPHCQLLLSQYLNVVSVDSNYIQKMALKGMFWVNRKIPHARNKYFPTFGEADRQRWNGENMPAAPEWTRGMILPQIILTPLIVSLGITLGLIIVSRIFSVFRKAFSEMPKRDHWFTEDGDGGDRSSDRD